jgi:hypothetical protein
MGLFEEQPLLLVPVILLVMIGYDLAKQGVRHLLNGGRLLRHHS